MASSGFYYAFDLCGGLLSMNYLKINLFDGSSSSRAGTSAAAIKALTGTNTNGVYWINLPTLGPTQVYCIMDSAMSGGGWMMALKATRGTTFSYSASYWTTINNLNPTDLTTNDADAKYDTYNYFPATDWLAIFPYDTTNGSPVYGGDVAGNTYGWTWVELNAVGSASTLYNFYANTRTQITKASNGYIYTATVPTPLNMPRYTASIWSSQAGFQWYGINYGGTGFPGGAADYVRWGFAWNNETDANSNDVRGGIGLNVNSYSAGDNIGCCQVNNGINRSMRMQWYVR
jgi:hypothetical protein